MEIKKLSEHLKLNRTKNTSIFISNTALVLVLSVSLFQNFQKDTVVTNNLNEHCQTSVISQNWMSDATSVRLGQYLSGVVGNVSPANAEFVKTQILPFASAETYQKVESMLNEQVDGLKEDRITLTYHAERAFVENGITFVTGKLVLSGPTGMKKTLIRTYEWGFEVQNYTPVFKTIKAYDDVPHDLEWKRLNEK